MKKHLIAAAALATLSTTAFAQNVTMYGTLDLGLQSVNKTDSSGLRRTAIESGGLSPSIFGFRGTEDLGGGTKASFNLEGHIGADTGVAQHWGGLFGRQANLSLSSSLGSLTLGKQYTSAVLAYAATDPRGLKETNSGLIAWATSQSPLTVAHTGNAASTNTNIPIDVFVANAVGASTTLGKVNLSAQYAFGEVAGDQSRNSAISLGAVYGDGPFTMSAGYQNQKGNNANTAVSQNKKSFVGVGYKFGAATVKANYLETKSNSTAGVEERNYKIAGFGIDYSTSANNTITVAYYDTKNKASGATDDDAKTTVLSDEYSLSKRTTLYATLATSKHGRNYTGGSAFANATANFIASANVTQTQYLLGVRHSF